MKKLIAILAAVMLLSACTVGPKEEPREPLVTPDASIPDNVVTEPEPDIEEPVEPEPVPDEIEAPDDGIISPAEPDVTEPALEDPSSDESAPDDEVIAITDPEYSVLYSTISLNVRKGPSTDYESIGALKEGEAVEVIGYAADYGWYMIKYKNGVGYVSGGYMTPDDPNPEPDDDYPPIEIGMDEMEKIINDYAAANGVRYEDVWLRYYYGTYSGGDAVVLSILGNAETDDIYHLKLGGYEFYLPSGSLRIYIHTRNGGFVELSDAYAAGLVTDSDLDIISYANKNSTELPMPSARTGSENTAGYPALGPLSSSVADKIKEDYEKANGLRAGVAYVEAYYGTYSGGDAVIMWKWDHPGSDVTKPIEALEQEFTVAGRQFYLGSTSLDITIHTKDGKFVPLSKAYELGLVSEADLDAISYYNLPKRNDTATKTVEPNYPVLENLSEDRAEVILKAYAKETNNNVRDLKLIGYFGTYSGYAASGEAVLIAEKDEIYRTKRNVVEWGAYKFYLPTNTLTIYIYDPNNNISELDLVGFTSVGLSDEDMAAIYHYCPQYPDGKYEF